MPSRLTMRKMIFAVLGIVIATLVLHAGSVNAQNYPCVRNEETAQPTAGFPPTNNAWRQAAGAIATPCFKPSAPGARSRGSPSGPHRRR
jgi:hypothetical protein